MPGGALLGALLACCSGGFIASQAQTNPPAVLDTNLAVRTVVSGLSQPAAMAFLGRSDFLVTEKSSGQVKRVVNGVVAATVLDLPVNSASERGLLGIALHPQFKRHPWVYLYWTESTTGADSTVLSETPLLGNRVDRFVWDARAQTLTFDRNIITLRSFQADAGQPLRGNHNGGIIRLVRAQDERTRLSDRHDEEEDDEDEGEEDQGRPDKRAKIYIFIGDNGRRGQMQNQPDGPGCTNPPCAAIPSGNLPDDQFGGPEPDNAHLTGVILRLNDDGTTPADNPFYVAGALRGGEAGANLQKVFAYGIRNGFGMAIDPFSGRLWDAQNGDDSFSELNLVDPGSNLGWVQVMGPIARVGEFKAIETSTNRDPLLGNVYAGLQQLRWPPANLADTPEGALSRLFMVYEGGDAFGAQMTGSQENPPVTTSGSAVALFTLNPDGTLSYELRATGPIENATQSHIHLGGRGQNGPVVTFLFGLVAGGQSFQAGDLIGSGTLSDSNVIARPGFTPTIANLVARMRQGRTYANLHTTAFPGGEVRGQIIVTDRAPVSHYNDPELSWRYEVAPVGLGFISSSKLGRQYRGDMIVGAARTFLAEGNLFRFKLTADRRGIAAEDPRLEDGVADNLFKFDITESETLLFGVGFGVGTDIHTGPNGNLFVVSLSNGAVYEIYRVARGRGHDD